MSTAKDQGTALVEFSFLLPVLLLIVLGACDFAIAIQQSMLVASAARAGAEFGASEGNSNNTTGMQTAADNAAAAVSGFTATASTWCTCTAGGTAVSCSSLCSTYYLPIQYVQVQSSISVPLLFPFVNLPPKLNLNANSILRAR